MSPTNETDRPAGMTVHVREGGRVYFDADGNPIDPPVDAAQPGQTKDDTDEATPEASNESTREGA